MDVLYTPEKEYDNVDGMLCDTTATSQKAQSMYLGKSSDLVYLDKRSEDLEYLKKLFTGYKNFSNICFSVSYNDPQCLNPLLNQCPYILFYDNDFSNMLNSIRALICIPLDRHDGIEVRPYNFVKINDFDISNHITPNKIISCNLHLTTPLTITHKNIFQLHNKHINPKIYEFLEDEFLIIGANIRSTFFTAV